MLWPVSCRPTTEDILIQDDVHHFFLLNHYLFGPKHIGHEDHMACAI
jgi:hypothetical protein